MISCQLAFVSTVLSGIFLRVSHSKLRYLFCICYVKWVDSNHKISLILLVASWPEGAFNLLQDSDPKISEKKWEGCTSHVIDQSTRIINVCMSVLTKSLTVNFTEYIFDPILKAHTGLHEESDTLKPQWSADITCMWIAGIRAEALIGDNMGMCV